MVTQTADLLNDPLLLFSPSVDQNGGRAGGCEFGIGISHKMTTATTTKITAILPTLISNNNNSIAPVDTTTTAAAAASAVASLQPSSTNRHNTVNVNNNNNSDSNNVIVEVNGSRFCIVPTLFRRVENLNWVQSNNNSNSSIWNSNNGVGGGTGGGGGGGGVMKLDAKCHPDVFEMVLKFFLFNSLPDMSKLSNRKATELIALASPLEGTQVLVQHAEFCLAANGGGGSSGGGGTNGSSSASTFLKRRLTSFSSLYSAKSSDREDKTGQKEESNTQTVTAIGSAVPGFQQPQLQSQLQLPLEQSANNQSYNPSSDRSVDNRSIPSHVDMKRSTVSYIHQQKSAPSTLVNNGGVGINRSDSNSTIEDESTSISKLSHPSGANSSGADHNENQSSQQFVAVPPSVTTFTPPRTTSSKNFTGRAMVGVDNRQSKPTTESSFAAKDKKTNKKDKKKNRKECIDFVDSRPKLPFHQRRSTKLFRTVLGGGGSDRNLRRMSHAECCRTSEHIL